MVGVLISSDLRPRNRCIRAKSRINRVLCFIARRFSNRRADVILGLYLALVRYLDRAVQFWSHCYGTEINTLVCSEEDDINYLRVEEIKGRGLGV